MEIKKLHIKNFRSLRDVKISPKNILALVGKNNSGKSNVIRALKLFFKGTKRNIEENCFYNHNIDKPIEIKIHFKNLTKWEKDQFEPWLNEDELKIIKKIKCIDDNNYKINYYAIISVPEPEWLQENTISGKKIKKWWEKDSLKVNGLDLKKELGTARPNVGEWENKAKEFIEKNKENIPFVE